MPEYYQNSILTIALSDTPGDYCGFLDQVRLSGSYVIAILFKSNKNNRVLKGPDKGCVQTEQVFLYYTKEKRKSTFRSCSYLIEHGWTLQEEILAVWTIYYNLGQLCWECQKHRKIESMYSIVEGYKGVNISLKYLFLHSLTDAVIGGSWYRIVEYYIQYKLTLPDNKFPVLSGIAREVNRQTGFIYIAGIWLEDFYCRLLQAFHRYSDRNGSYITPTWSWASIKYIVSTARHPWNRSQDWKDYSDIKAKLLDCEVTLRGNDLFGRIMYTTITLCGLQLLFLYWKSVDKVLLGISQIDDCPKCMQSIEYNFDKLLNYPDWYSTRDVLVNPGSDILNNLYLFQIAILLPGDIATVLACHLLILIPIATVGQFRRVGAAVTNLVDFGNTGGWEQKDVTIV